MRMRHAIRQIAVAMMAAAVGMAAAAQAQQRPDPAGLTAAGDGP